MNSIRVLVVDDQALIRTGLAGILAAEPDITIVGEAADGEQAVALARDGEVDVVLMDLRMPTMDGVEATRLIAATTERVAVLVLTTFETDDYVLAALRAGARGFLGKNVDADILTNAVRVVAAGGTQLSGAAMSVIADTLAGATNRPASLGSSAVAHPDGGRISSQRLEVLTEREREVAALVARGLSNGEIARDLFISLHTAKTHVHRTMTKLGARDRTQLALMVLAANGE